MAKQAEPPDPTKERTLPPLDLPADLSVDLYALSEAYHGAPQARLVREAIRAFIDRQIASDPVARARFTEAKQTLCRPARPRRLERNASSDGDA